MIRIGISGWRYEPWRGVLYPEGLPQRRELEFCGRHFPTVEINGSFYSLQRPEYYDDWYRETPPGFVFAVKGSRYITHLLRLKNIEKPLANFFASGIFNLRDKLGPFLWQFPPQMFRYEPRALRRLLSLLPRTTDEALALARRRDARMTGRSRLAIDAEPPAAPRGRDPPSELHERRTSSRCCRKHDIGLVVADTAGKWPKLFHVTVRLRLRAPARRREDLHQRLLRTARSRAGRGASATGTRDGRDVYVYFDNDVKVRAPFDALNLMRKLGLCWGTPVHAPGTRVPRLKYAYGPRVTAGIPRGTTCDHPELVEPALERAVPQRRARARAAGGSASAGAGRR